MQSYYATFVSNEIETRALRTGPYSFSTLSWVPGGDDSPVQPIVALQDPSFWAAASSVARPCGYLPIVVDGRPEIEYILNEFANPFMSAQAVRSAITLNAIIRGAGYAVVLRNPENDLPSIYPVSEDNITAITGENDAPAYEIKLGGEKKRFDFDQLLVLPGLGLDGASGLPINELGARSIGLSLNAQKFASKFYKTGVMVGGVLKSPHQLSDEAYKRLQDAFSSAHAGIDQANRVPILEGGTEFVPNSMAPTDFDMSQSRQLSALDSCRLVNVNPVHIGDLSHSTMNNVEQINQLHVSHSLMPWFRAWEIAIRRYILREFDTKTSIYFDYDDLAKPDRKSRIESYSQGIQNGIYSRQWVQKQENLPIDTSGPTWLTPLNMQASGVSSNGN